MKDLAYSGLKVLAVVVLAIVIINDVGALVMTQIGAGDMAKTVADASVSSYKTSHSPAEARVTAESVARQRDLKLTGFLMDNQGITVTIEVPPRKTFLIHRIKAAESYLSASVTVTSPLESPTGP